MTLVVAGIDGFDLFLHPTGDIDSCCFRLLWVGGISLIRRTTLGCGCNSIGFASVISTAVVGVLGGELCWLVQSPCWRVTTASAIGCRSSLDDFDLLIQANEVNLLAFLWWVGSGLVGKCEARSERASPDCSSGYHVDRLFVTSHRAV